MSCPLLRKNNLWPSMHPSEVLNRTRYHEVVPHNTKKPLSPEFMQAKDQRFASNFQWLWPELKQFNAHRTLFKALKNKSLFTALKKLKTMYFTHHIRCRTNLKGKKNENLVIFNEQMKKRVFQLVQEEIHV